MIGFSITPCSYHQPVAIHVPFPAMLWMGPWVPHNFAKVLGGFHSHGGTPIAGWFIMIKTINMDDLAVPLVSETFICTTKQRVALFVADWRLWYQKWHFGEYCRIPVYLISGKHNIHIFGICSNRFIYVQLFYLYQTFHVLICIVFSSKTLRFGESYSDFNVDIPRYTLIFPKCASTRIILNPRIWPGALLSLLVACMLLLKAQTKSVSLTQIIPDDPSFWMVK